MIGISMSNSTTSGNSVLALVTASRPLAASPTMTRCSYRTQASADALAHDRMIIRQQYSDATLHLLLPIVGRSPNLTTGARQRLGPGGILESGPGDSPRGSEWRAAGLDEKLVD